MIEKDLFGLTTERKIKSSGVREVFTPSRPISNVSLFCGREGEVRRILECLNTPGQHALIYGDRGVGKSSLANITCDLLIKNLLAGKLYKKRCDSSDTFATILEEPLKAVGVNIFETSVERSKSGGIGGKFANLSGSSKSTQSGSALSSLMPSWVASKLGSENGLLLIDEFDVISNDDDKKRIAEIIKLLSDSGSPFKILIVGIAESASELTAGHPSVQRCLKETHIGRMKDSELLAIIDHGATRLKIKFETGAKNRIVSLSSGFPHFTHLLSLKAAEDVIVEDRDTVTLRDVIDSMRRAVDDAEGTLREEYNRSTRSANTDEYKKILLAAACCHDEEIKALELRNKYNELFKTTINQQKLNNHFQKIVSQDNSNILRRIAKGVYKFSDPRMPSFIKIAQEFTGDN